MMNTKVGEGFSFRFLVAVFLLSAWTRSASSAEDTAQAFIAREYSKLMQFVRQGSKAQIEREMQTMVDYEAVIHRSFGKICPLGMSNCKDHWSELSSAQKTEISSLLKKLVEKNYKKNLDKTLNYDLSFKSTSESNAESKVRTEARSKANPREAPIQIDYIVVQGSDGFRVVDIVTEGSSLTKNYYVQFHRMFSTPNQGYAHVVKKLNEKLSAP